MNTDSECQERSLDACGYILKLEAYMGPNSYTMILWWLHILCYQKPTTTDFLGAASLGKQCIDVGNRNRGYLCDQIIARWPNLEKLYPVMRTNH